MTESDMPACGCALCEEGIDHPERELHRVRDTRASSRVETQVAPAHRCHQRGCHQTVASRYNRLHGTHTVVARVCHTGSDRSSHARYYTT